MPQIVVTDVAGEVDRYPLSSVRSESDEGGPTILVVTSDEGSVLALYNEGAWMKALVHGEG